MDPSREQLAPLEAQFNAHPAIQTFIADLQQHHGFNVMGWLRAVGQAARETGIQMPHDYQPTVQGGKVVLEKKSFIQRNGWFLPAVAVGAPLAAGAALGAFGGAAAAGGAGAGGSSMTPGALLGGADTAATAGVGITGATVTSGASGAIPSILGKVGKYADRLSPILGQAAANQAYGRRADEYLDQSRDRNALDSYEAGLKAPGTRLRTSTDASMIKNWSPAKFEWGGPGSVAAGNVPHFSGGYNNPDLIDPRTRQLSDDIIAQQLEQQLGGGGPNRGGPPPLSPPRRNSTGDKILGTAATLAPILGIWR